MSAPQPVTADAARREAAVGAVLDDLKTFRFRFWAPMLLGLIMLFDSWDSIAIAYVMPSLKAEWGLSPVTIGFLISSGYAGQFIGAIAFGALAERVGRMPVFLASTILMCVLALACALAPDWRLLLGVRFVQGLVIGGALPVSVTYINELAPTRTRGRYFALFQVLAMSGYAASSVASTFIIPHLGWRWLFGIGALPILLIPLAALTLPESPRWLARVGRWADANKALARLGGGPALTPVSQGEPEAPAQGKAKASPRLSMTALFSPAFLKRTLVITLLWFLCAFTNFGVFTWIPSLYVSEFGLPVESALRYSALANVGFLIVAPLCGLVMDRIGRRPIAIGGTFIAAAALLSLIVYPHPPELHLVALVVLGQQAISAAMLILWPYTAETYPTPVRAFGVGYGSSVARGASMLTPLAVGFVLGSGGSVTIVFAIFGACALAAFAVFVTQTRETARKALDSI